MAADVEQCSEIGVSILRQGGSAVDAAIAVMLSVGVINLHSTGTGGGGFMVIYNSKSRTIYATDFRDKAPLNASTFMFDGVPDLESRHGMRRDDSEKIESLKFDFFLALWILFNHPIEVQNVAGLVLIACLIPEIASCWDAKYQKVGFCP